MVRVESSIALVGSAQAEALRVIAGCVARRLAAPPENIRVRIEHVELADAFVGGANADAAKPWLVVWVSILEGRPQEQRAVFMEEIAGVVAASFGVDVAHVRVLLTEYPKIHWGIGRASAAALGR